LIFHVFAALAEFIRELIVEGTHEGLDAARHRGQKLGQPTVMTPEKIRAASELVGKESIAAIARLLNVNRATLYAHVPQLQNRHRTALPATERARLDELLVVADGERVCELERWRKGVSVPSGKNLEKALNGADRDTVETSNDRC